MSRNRRRRTIPTDSTSSENLHRIQASPEAPNDERRDARAQLHRRYQRGDNDPATKSMVDMVLSYRDEFEKASQLTASKDRRSQAVGDMTDLNFAQILPDGRVERPSSYTFTTLRRIANEIPVVQAILHLRKRQMAQFCNVPEADGQLGFKVMHRDRDHKITKAEEKVARVIESWILNSGFETDVRERMRMDRQPMVANMSAIVDDSLVLDAVALEMQKNRAGDGYAGFWVMDSSTVRLVHPDRGYNGDKNIFFVEVNAMETVRATYTYESGVYFTRNFSSDISRYNYGTSEIERMLRVLNGMMIAFNYNMDGFNRSVMPKGFLKIFGKYDQQTLDKFKHELVAFMKGPSNRHSFPILAAKDKDAGAEWMNTNLQFDEMAFARWITLLVSLVCSLYGVSPEEINLDNFSARGSGGLNGTDTQERITSAQDKGFKPFVGQIERLYNDWIVPTLDPRFQMQFVGLDPINEDRIQKNKEACMTVDEVRAELGLKTHPVEILRDAPVSPTLQQVYLQTLAQPGPEDGGGEGPGEPQGGDEEPPEDDEAQPDKNDGGNGAQARKSRPLERLIDTPMSHVML